jgi:hypothetical protein
VMGYPDIVDWSRVGHPASGAKARQSSGAFSARLNSHLIDEDLSMGTPVKSCPDTKRRVGVRGLPGPKIRTRGTHLYLWGSAPPAHPA